MRLLSEKYKVLFRQPWFGGAIGAVLAVICGLCLLMMDLGKGFLNFSYDLPFLARAQKHLVTAL